MKKLIKFFGEDNVNFVKFITLKYLNTGYFKNDTFNDEYYLFINDEKQKLTTRKMNELLTAYCALQEINYSSNVLIINNEPKRCRNFIKK